MDRVAFNLAGWIGSVCFAGIFGWTAWGWMTVASVIVGGLFFLFALLYLGLCAYPRDRDTTRDDEWPLNAMDELNRRMAAEPPTLLDARGTLKLPDDSVETIRKLRNEWE